MEVKCKFDGIPTYAPSPMTMPRIDGVRTSFSCVDGSLEVILTADTQELLDQAEAAWDTYIEQQSGTMVKTWNWIKGLFS